MPSACLHAAGTWSICYS